MATYMLNETKEQHNEDKTYIAQCGCVKGNQDSRELRQLRQVTSRNWRNSRLGPDFPALEPRHLPLGVGRFRGAAGIVMLPAVVSIGNEDVVEDHCAKPQHHDFSDMPYVETGVEAVRLKIL